MGELESAHMPLGASVSSTASSAPSTTLTTTSRHSALVRVTHWIITLCFFALLVSGVEIRDLSPALLLG